MRELESSIPQADDLIKGMKLSCTFKAVTIEMLEDKEFQKKVLEAFPYEKQTKPFKDFDAVEGTEQQDLFS